MRKKGLFQSLVLATVLGSGFLAAWTALGTMLLQVGRHAAFGASLDPMLLIQRDGRART
jgi:hypothetical protein